MSGASEQANGRASGPALQSVFLVVLRHSAVGEEAVSTRKLGLFFYSGFDTSGTFGS